MLPQSAKANPDTTFAIVDSLSIRLPTGANVDACLAGVRRERGLVPRRCRRGAEEQDRPHRLHRWRQEIDLIKKFEAGYTAGAKAVNPDIVVDGKYIGPAGDRLRMGFNVPTKAKEIANALVRTPAPTSIYTAAGGSGAGAFEAAGSSEPAQGVGDRRRQRPVQLVADPTSRSTSSPRCSSSVDVAVYDTIKAVSWTARSRVASTRYDLRSDGVGYSTSGGYVDDIKDQLDAYKADIISGKIVGAHQTLTRSDHIVTSKSAE